MSDDPSTAADPEAGRSDLYARIQDLQDDVDSGLTAAQVDSAVRGAVGASLPGLVSDAVSSAVTGTLPLLVISVADAVTERLQSPDTEGIEARLAALEDALDEVGDRLEALTRDQASTTVASLDDLRTQLADLRAEPHAPGAADDGRREDFDALREDLADALDYVRTSLGADLASVRQRLDDFAGRASDRQVDDDDMEALHVRFDTLLTAVDTAAQGVRDGQSTEVERLRAALADQAAADAAAAAVERAVATAT
ncbi:MAG: hypothetical protein ACRDTP_05015, partial [Mycobacteriales bacterium]